MAPPILNLTHTWPWVFGSTAHPPYAMNGHFSVYISYPQDCIVNMKFSFCYAVWGFKFLLLAFCKFMERQWRFTWTICCGVRDGCVSPGQLSTVMRHVSWCVWAALTLIGLTSKMCKEVCYNAAYTPLCHKYSILLLITSLKYKGKHI